jgi:hypothetical protein
MSDDRKKHLWPWIAGLLIGLPVLNVASFGPACWIANRSERIKIPTFYWPIQTYVPYCPGGAAAVAWYAKLCVPTDSRGVLVPFHNRNGKLEWVRYAAEPPHGIDPGLL